MNVQQDVTDTLTHVQRREICARLEIVAARLDALTCRVSAWNEARRAPAPQPAAPAAQGGS